MEAHSRAVQARERVLAERQTRLDETQAVEARYQAALEKGVREREIEDQKRQMANNRRENLPKKATVLGPEDLFRNKCHAINSELSIWKPN
jgi:hypothetical protein